MGISMITYCHIQEASTGSFGFSLDSCGSMTVSTDPWYVIWSVTQDEEKGEDSYQFFVPESIGDALEITLTFFSGCTGETHDFPDCSKPQIQEPQEHGTDPKCCSEYCHEFHCW